MSNPEPRSYAFVTTVNCASHSRLQSFLGVYVTTVFKRYFSRHRHFQHRRASFSNAPLSRSTLRDPSFTYTTSVPYPVSTTRLDWDTSLASMTEPWTSLALAAGMNRASIVTVANKRLALAFRIEKKRVLNAAIASMEENSGRDVSAGGNDRKSGSAASTTVTA